MAPCAEIWFSITLTVLDEWEGGIEGRREGRKEGRREQGGIERRREGREG
jgi:hypothetical protein